MILMRVKLGLVFDAAGLAIMAIAFSILMFLIVIELLFSLRARVELGENAVKMTLPAGRGPTPMLRYKSYTIPYDRVQTVETRREIYGGSLVPVLLKGARLITKDGTSIPIGYVSEANVDPCFPILRSPRRSPTARLPLIDRGQRVRSFRRKFLGWKGQARQRGRRGGRHADRQSQSQPPQYGHRAGRCAGGADRGRDRGRYREQRAAIGQTASAIVGSSPAKVPAKK